MKNLGLVFSRQFPGVFFFFFLRGYELIFFEFQNSSFSVEAEIALGGFCDRS